MLSEKSTRKSNEFPKVLFIFQAELLHHKGAAFLFLFFSTFLETVEFLEAKCCGYFLSSCIPVRSAI